MGRWKWFMRAGRVVIDLTGQVSRNEPDSYGRRVVEHVVPELVETSRCDGAVVWQRTDQRRNLSRRNQRAARSRASSSTWAPGAS